MTTAVPAPSIPSPEQGGEAIRFAAGDGRPLGGTFFRPTRSNDRAVLINSAAGAPQRYYGRFASFLAARGFTVLTHDYRGVGESRAGPVRADRASMADWARLDAAAALAWLTEQAPRSKLQVVGHSFGGQSIALIPGAERIGAAIWIASQSGYWRNWPAGVPRAGMWFLTHAVLPSVSTLLGYFPMSALGQGEDLPAGVSAEWARWCRHPQYLVGDLDAHERYAQFRAPVLAWWIEDDRYAPRAAVEALAGLHPSSRTELRPVRPGDHGGRRIGHFGFFRDRFRDTLWVECAEWLASH